MATLTLRKPVSAERLKALGVAPPPPTPAAPLIMPAPAPAPAPTSEQSPPKALRRHMQALALLRQLKDRWPNSIGAGVPLKIGVAADIGQAIPDIDVRVLGAALSAHTRSIPYLRALLVEGAVRADLDGVAVEPVSPEHREHAAARIEEARARKRLRDSAETNRNKG